MKINTTLTLTSSPNFKNKEGNYYLVRCPDCKSKNYGPAVSSGICAFCKTDIRKYEEHVSKKLSVDDIIDIRKSIIF